MSNNEIIKKECKFVTHIPKYQDRPDLHFIKEVSHHPDGSIEKNLRILKDFKRPFYITKPHYQNYTQKKESEPIDRLIEYKATESDLIEEAGKKLGSRFIGKNAQRFIKDSPFVYGMDVTSSTYIKKAYFDKYQMFTPFEVCVLDIEKEIDGDERISVISISINTKTYTVILDGWLPETDDNKRKLDYAYKKYIPDVDYMHNIEDTTEWCKTEIEMVEKIFKKLHEWGPDIVEIWNILYDITHILDVIEKAGKRPEDIFSDPSVPKDYRYFRLKKGKMSKLTEKGVHKGLDFFEQWHTVITPAKFYIVDGASVYYYIRQGSKKVPSGYSLDSLLGKELGDKFKKIKIEDGVAERLEKADWHLYMSKNRKIEYVIYNKYDTKGPLALDNFTKDICQTMPLLSVHSPFYMFDSNPVRIVEAFYFFYLERGEVMGTAPNTKDDDKRLGMGSWIVLLPSTRIKNNGVRLMKDSEYIETSIRAHTFDADQSAGYPSDTQIANVSKATTQCEVLAIEGIGKEEFKKQNINSFFGEVNHLEYAQQMHNFPSLFKIGEMMKKYKKDNIV